MVDKNQAIINYLLTCPVLAENDLFFNFAQEQDNNKHIVTQATDKSLEKPFIDGSVLKQYTFTLIDYRSIEYQALVNVTGYSNESVDEMFDIQSIIDWIDEQETNHNYPDFGENCKVDEIQALTESPNLNGVDRETTPNLAKYSIAIRVNYIDYSKCIWNYGGSTPSL